ncbi:MAG: hypothetical protein WEC59_06825 [Salibacteraceae bacterium]
MIKLVRSIGFAALGLLAAFGCAKKYEWSPTFAIPLANGELTVAEVIGARPSEVQSDTNANDLVFYKLVYRDTLEPVPFSSFGTGTVPAGAKYTMDEQNAFLRMFGNADNGDFQFTNPEVEFTFVNSVNMDFEIDFKNTYTKNVNTNTEFPFSIDASDVPVAVSAADSNGNGSGSLLITNDNTNDALTDVFSPTPKFLYYTPEITAPNGGSNVDNGEIQIYSKVILPFEGYGRVVRFDTVFYNYKDSLFKFGGDDWGGSAGTGDFALLRMNFENGLPLEVSVTADLYKTQDSLIGSRIGSIPFFDENDDPNADHLVLAGATQASINPSGTPTSTPVSSTTEIKIERTPPSSKFIGLDDLEGDQTSNNPKGVQAIILRLEFNTTGYSNDKPIKIYGDQTLKFNMGVRFNGEAQFERPSLR